MPLVMGVLALSAPEVVSQIFIKHTWPNTYFWCHLTKHPYHFSKPASGFTRVLSAGIFKLIFCRRKYRDIRGACNSDTWLTIPSNVLNLPVYDTRHGRGAVGAANLAASKPHFTSIMEQKKGCSKMSTPLKLFFLELLSLDVSTCLLLFDCLHVKYK